MGSAVSESFLGDESGCWIKSYKTFYRFVLLNAECNKNYTIPSFCL